VKQKPLNIRPLAEGEAEQKWERKPPAKHSHDTAEKKTIFREDRKASPRPFKTTTRQTAARGTKKR
jgi:hypothetical protein